MSFALLHLWHCYNGEHRGWIVTEYQTDITYPDSFRVPLSLSLIMHPNDDADRRCASADTMGSSEDPIFTNDGSPTEMASRRALQRHLPGPFARSGVLPTHDVRQSGTHQRHRKGCQNQKQLHGG